LFWCFGTSALLILGLQGRLGNPRRSHPTIRVSDLTTTSFTKDLTCLSDRTSPTFPSTCLSPDQPGYGQVVSPPNGRRKPRRPAHAAPINLSVHHEPHANWTVVTPLSRLQTSAIGHGQRGKPGYSLMSSGPSCYTFDPGHAGGNANEYHGEYRQLSLPVSHLPPLANSSAAGGARNPRYASYPDRGSAEDIVLPPIRPHRNHTQSPVSPFMLPPISVMEDRRIVDPNDSAAVLRRLQREDEKGEGNIETKRASGSMSISDVGKRWATSPWILLIFFIDRKLACRKRTTSGSSSRSHGYSSDDQYHPNVCFAIDLSREAVLTVLPAHPKRSIFIHTCTLSQHTAIS
jgi:hypothetical protein